ncbi:MAG: FKBP-type peptidyl-prolyl cis-trans isomerase, partial [Cyclobacteriaceae bacterium]
PIVYPLSNLIRGWQIAFPNFPVGTRATLYIPSSLGYGPQGSPPTIPANANLIFEVELVGIEK